MSNSNLTHQDKFIETWGIRAILTEGNPVRTTAFNQSKASIVSLNPAVSLSNKWAFPALRGQRWISPVVLILLWEAGARLGLIPAHILAAPSAVIGDAWQMID